MKYTIYRAINKQNNKSYIGQTIISIQARKNRHFLNAFTKNEKYKFYNALRKYGWNSFAWEELENGESKYQEYIDNREKYWISFYTSNTCGYNMTKGGNSGSGRKCSKSTKKKISKANTGKVRTEEQLKRLGDACRGEKNGMYGKKHSKKSKKIMAQKASVRSKGKGNPIAKQWQLISPDNIEYHINGELKKFCDENNLIISLLKKFLNTKVDISKLKLIHNRHKKRTLNTNEWSLHEVRIVRK